MRVAFSIAFWFFFALSCMVLFCGALVLWLVTLPFDRNGRVLHLYSCFWAQLYFYVNPLWRLRVEGRQKLPWHGSAVLVCNHQSLGDILALFGLYRPFKWVSKESVFKAPFLGWNMRLNRYVPLRRGDKESIAAMMGACDAWLKRGVPVMLFPEGTRSPDGELKPFKDGAFRLSMANDVPLIPMVLNGTADTLPKHGLVMRTSCACRLKVLDPVDPKAFDGDLVAFKEHVHALMAKELAGLRLQGAHERPPPAVAEVAGLRQNDAS